MLNGIRLLFRTLSPLERAVLESVPPVLPEVSADVCRRQIDAITRVQRVRDWTEVCFYRMQRGRPTWDGVPRFDRFDSFQLSESSYVIAGTAYTSSVWCVNGHLFSLVTRPNSRSHVFWQPESLETRLLADPSSNGQAVRDLPESYTEWHGSPAGDVEWDVLPPDEAYELFLPDGDFVVLATRFGSELLVTPLDSRDECFFRIESGGSLIPTPGTFADAIRDD